MPNHKLNKGIYEVHELYNYYSNHDKINIILFYHDSNYMNIIIFI